MISSEVQRTLVKSPPELWAELSDPDALARHLGDLGDIRITRVEPEEKVEWESPGTTGTVLIKASGWGTRVTLTVQREMSSSEQPAAAEPQEEAAPPETAAEVAPADEGEAAPAPAQAEAENQETALEDEEDRKPAVDAVPAPAGPGELPVAPAPGAEDPDRAPAAPETPPAPAPARRGFIARFLYFFRGSGSPAEPPASAVKEPVAEPPAGPSTEPVSVAGPPEPSGDATPAPTDEPAPEAAGDASPPEEEPESPDAEASESADRPAADVAQELLAAEESATEQVTAVLTAALDRLGAAHHRPFSRA